MKLLIDNALSPRIARALTTVGHDATHVRDRGLSNAPDAIIFGLAESEARVLVSADTDFATLLALRQAVRPSVVLLRHALPRRPEVLGRFLVASLEDWREALERGALITVDDTRVRVRPLPIVRR